MSRYIIAKVSCDGCGLTLEFQQHRFDAGEPGFMTLEPLGEYLAKHGWVVQRKAIVGGNADCCPTCSTNRGRADG